mgnify:CR=1 FL=1
MPDASPVILHVPIGPACQNRCPGCGNVYAGDRLNPVFLRSGSDKESPPPPLNGDEWRALLARLAPHTHHLKLTGGEIFIIKGIMSFIERMPTEAKAAYFDRMSVEMWPVFLERSPVFKTEVIRRRGPWRNLEAVEFETLDWVDWFNNRRLLESIGDIPPAEYEEMYHSGQLALAVGA